MSKRDCLTREGDEASEVATAAATAAAAKRTSFLL
jgi:hypothetical protein